MFKGERINFTENRAVLHIALRADGPVWTEGNDVHAEAVRTLARMRQFCDGVRSGQLTGFSGHPCTDVVNIGIGGSDLGPALVAEALAPYASPRFKTHFVSNVDGAHLAEVLAELNPETTLFIVASKTFTTLETLANARTAREWLIAKSGDGTAAALHFAAVTANAAAARDFGVDSSRNSSSGTGSVDVTRSGPRSGSRRPSPSAWTISKRCWAALVRWTSTSRAPRSSAMCPSCLHWWASGTSISSGCLRTPCAVRPVAAPASDYLQQLEMESNGKGVTRDGAPVDYATAPVVWGSPGTNGQHAFFQMLHQGTQVVPADFIACCQSHHALGGHHEILLSNFFAQTEALMRGKSADEASADMLAQELKRKRSRNCCRTGYSPATVRAPRSCSKSSIRTRSGRCSRSTSTRCSCRA